MNFRAFRAPTAAALFLLTRNDVGLSFPQLFITATDTGVGKTVWTAALFQWCMANNHPTLPCKPIQSGCRLDGDFYHAPDLEFTAACGGFTLSRKAHAQLSPIRLRDACSPHLAAERQGVELDPTHLLDHCRGLLEMSPSLLIEGAGGLEVPITRSFSMLDLICALELPVLVVARSDLGTLNHTLLTVHRLREREVEPAAIACSAPSPETPVWMVEDNLRTLREATGLPICGPMPWIEGLDTESGVLSGGLPHEVQAVAARTAECLGWMSAS